MSYLEATFSCFHAKSALTMTIRNGLMGGLDAFAAASIADEVSNNPADHNSTTSEVSPIGRIMSTASNSRYYVC